MKIKSIFMAFLMAMAFNCYASASKYEATDNETSLSPSIIFNWNEDAEVKTNLGVSLKNAGFTQISVNENKEGFTYWDGGKDEWYTYPSYVKTFSRGDYTIKYKYAINKFDGYNEVVFDWLKITFPSKTELDNFIKELKNTLEKSTEFSTIFTYPNDKSVYYIGGIPDDFDSWQPMGSFNSFEIKGKTIEFSFALGMNPHCMFDD